MSYRFQFKFIHIYVTRVIGHGTYGLSVRSLYMGVMNSKPIISFLPLGQSALKRFNTLLKCIDQWSSELGRSIETLDPEGWFFIGHDHDRGEYNIDVVWIHKFRPVTFIYSPSPGVDVIVIEELRQSCHKRTDSAHILVVPRFL